MKTATLIARLVVRLFGLILLVLGVLFWSGHARELINTHMLLGVLFVIALWVLSGIAAASRASGGLVALGVVWGVVVLALGMTQASLMPGPAHWVIQVLHLVVGLIAMGLGETMGKRIQASSAAA